MIKKAYPLPPKPKKPPPLQVGLKHLLALPFGVATFFAFAPIVGTPQAGLFLVFILTVAGLRFNTTRTLSIALLAFFAIILSLLWFYGGQTR